MTDAPLRVEVRRSGGFAGLVTEHAADTTTLTPEAALELRRLVSALEAAEPPRDARSRGADRFQYDITVLDGGRSQEFTADDGVLSAEQRALVTFVEGTVAPSDEV